MDNTLCLPVGYEIAPPDHITGEDDLWTGTDGLYWCISLSDRVGKKVSEIRYSSDISIRPIQQPKQQEQSILIPPEGYTVISDPDYVYKKGDYFWSCDWIPCEASVGMTIRELHEEDSGDIEYEIFPYAATKIVEEEVNPIRKYIESVTKDHLTERYINSLEKENKMSEEKKTAEIQEEYTFNLGWCNEPKFDLARYATKRDLGDNYNFYFESLDETDFSADQLIDLFDELIDGLSQMRLRVLKDIK